MSSRIFQKSNRTAYRYIQKEKQNWLAALVVEGNKSAPFSSMLYIQSERKNEEI